MTTTDTPTRGGGPPLAFALIGIGGLVLMVVLLVLSALGVGMRFASATPTMGQPGAAAERTRAIVAASLGAAGFQTQDPRTPYRPGESPELINVPRRLVQAILPADLEGGNVVIYELPSNGEAERIGKDFLTYLGSGTGAIQYPRDTQFVLRRVGETLVFFAWSPQGSPDPRTPDLAAAVGTIGEPLGP
jgi:hypothetical protein